MRIVRIAIAAAVVAIIAITPSATAVPAATGPSGSITVSAAASLTDVLPVIAKAFERRFPGVTVKFNFAGSSALVEQVIAGAPVDVIATASESTLWKATNAGLTGRPLLFAKNTMAIALPPGNRAGVTQLSDLQRPGVLVAVCLPT
ncbi:MAG: extracellular solute-binding protein, partial [bacterium]|nr:extracellular solute-binding protein [bacterium]